MKAIGFFLAFLLFLCVAAAPRAHAAPIVRVGLAIHTFHADVACPAGLDVHIAGGKIIATGNAARFDAGDDGRILVNGKAVAADSIIVRPNAPFVFNKRSYRGLVEIESDAGAMDVVNLVGMNEYLYGVVGSEMLAQWPIEALKAQAVLARTYAMKKIGERKEFQYDVLPTAADQVYDGTENETPATREAVDDTRDEVVTYDGQLIMAYYHSDCGGRTEDGNNAFKGDFPYLKSVVCPYEKDSPYQSWQKTYTLADISRETGMTVTNLSISQDPETRHVEKVTLATNNGPVMLTGNLFRKLFGPREIRSTYFTVQPIERVVLVPKMKEMPMKTVVEYASTDVAQTRTTSAVDPVGNGNGQVYLIDGTGALFPTTVSKDNPFVVMSADGVISIAYRDLAAMYRKTTLFFKKMFFPKLVKKDMGKKLEWEPVKVPAAFEFTGSGWGHGVGMCQWGARGMALLGKNYQDILHYYYQGVEIEKLSQ